MKNRSFQILMMISVMLIVSMACSLGSGERFESTEPPPGTAPTTEATVQKVVLQAETPTADPLPASTATQKSVLDEIIEGLLFTTKINPADGAVMVYVPDGEFLMGSEDEGAWDDEKPQHTVYLDAYWFYQHPVTNAQFAAFVDASGHQTTAEEAGWSYVFDGSNLVQTDGAYWGAPEGPGSSLTGRGDHPVVQVSWFDAVAYCQWAGGRLPTEAEWEKAARGTDGRKYPWGNEPVTGDRANFCDVNCTYGLADKSQDDGYAHTSPVGSYPSGASPYGALDMAGNVWEWVADWFADDYYSRSDYDNPLGPTGSDRRVVRGGSWYDIRWGLRVSRRDGGFPDGGDSNYGFRCLRSP